MVGVTDNTPLNTLLAQLAQTHTWLDKLPYSIPLYIEQAVIFRNLGYPDLAVGAAYKALLLGDALNDDCDEYHESALIALLKSCLHLPDDLRGSWSAHDLADDLKSLDLNDHQNQDEDENSDDEDEDVASDDESAAIDDDRREQAIQWVNTTLLPIIYALLAENLLVCQCYRSAYKQCQLGLKANPENVKLLDIQQTVISAVRASVVPKEDLSTEVTDLLEDWPDAGLVRRELYAWNDLEPDRFSDESLEFLNAEMAKCAPMLEVKAVDLPVLTGEGEALTVKQLGVFAREDISPGEAVLSEVSLLTANNRLQDALCDACNKDIEDLGTASSEATMCGECSAIFCSQDCLDMADEQYHPAVCDRDVDSIARDVPPAQAADSLYLLLLLRSFALAETQEVHPLDIKEVKYIWGDYHFLDVARTWTPPSSTDSFSSLPRSLPFNFGSNVVLPFHMLTKMDVDIFREHRRYDVWIFNTLYAKFRGTASARLSGVSKTAAGLKLSRRRGPEVSAVHPCWCLANHSCDPNVQWEWGGRVEFKTRESRVEWKRDGTEESKAPVRAGLKKGEEVLNHYCDIGLDVQLRREWAKGALGGDCMCERCKWEANE